MQIAFSNMRLRGSLTLTSEQQIARNTLEVILTSTRARHLSIRSHSTDVLSVTLRRALFYDSYLDFESLTTTKAAVVDCVFDGGATSPPPPGGAATNHTSGLHFRISDRGKHLITLSGTRFTRYRNTAFNALHPDAALTVYSSGSDTVSTRVEVLNCTFHDNERAIDLSLLGKATVNTSSLM